MPGTFQPGTFQIANFALIAYTPSGVETHAEAQDVSGWLRPTREGENHEAQNMSIQNPIINVAVAVNSSRSARPRLWARGLFVLALGAPLMFFSAPMSARGQAVAAPQAAPSLVQTDVKLVIGGEKIKNGSQGTLSIVGSSLQFATSKAKVELEASSILDISTNEDSRQDITGAAKFATMAIPYGGGRVLSLFSHKVDVLTVEFKNANGGYHGAIFVLPQGQAAPIKKQLVAMGAKASVPLADPAPADKNKDNK
jgi:hypothetical protein